MLRASSHFAGKALPIRSCASCACSSLPRNLREASSTAPQIRHSTHQCRHRLRLRLSRVQAAPSQSVEAEAPSVPEGYVWYETMIILRPDLNEENRDMELAKFEAYLQKEGAVGIDVLVRPGSQQLAYPIKGYWDGIYVLYFYAADPKTAHGTQKLLSMPPIDSELNILRHMTFRQ